MGARPPDWPDDDRAKRRTKRAAWLASAGAAVAAAAGLCAALGVVSAQQAIAIGTLAAVLLVGGLVVWALPGTAAALRRGAGAGFLVGSLVGLLRRRRRAGRGKSDGSPEPNGSAQPNSHALAWAGLGGAEPRVRPYPDWLQRTFDGIAANPEVYDTMNGPSEFHVIGPLKDFDIVAELGLIEVPTLLFCGEFDEVTPSTVAQAHEAMPGSQFVILDGCSHNSQAERPDAVIGLVRGWLAGVEASLHGR